MIDYVIVGAYLVYTLLLGLSSGRGVRGIYNYSMTNKQYPTSVLVATVTATLIGAENVFGLTQGVFEVGILYVMISLIIPLVNFLVAIYISSRMVCFQGMISVGDIMGSFYGDIGQVMTGIAGFMLCTGYVGAQVAAMGYLCSYLYEIPTVVGVMIGAGIVIIYSSLGGIHAIIRTDVTQFLVIIFSVPALTNIVLNLNGGYSCMSIFQSLPISHLTIFPQGKDMTYYVCLSLVFFVPFLDPAFMQRMLMAKTKYQIRHTFKIAAGIQAVFFILMGAVALIAVVMVPHVSSREVVPYLIKNILPWGIQGIVISGVLAIIMSTADSYLNAGSICFAHDCVKTIMRQRINDYQEFIIARWATVFIGMGSAIAALTSDSVMSIVLMFCNFWVPVVIVPLISGIFGYSVSKKAFIASVIAGVSVSLIWMIFLRHHWSIDGMIPGLLANALVFFLFDKSKTLLSFCRK